MANPIDLTRLSDAHRRGRTSLEYARVTRREMIREYVGQHYSEEGTKYPVPLNLMALYSQIVPRSLIAHNPRVMYSTWNAQLKPQVATMQKWANRRIEEMYFAETMREIVFDFLYGPGIAYVSLTTPDEAALHGYQQTAGQATVHRISLDDFNRDSGSTCFRDDGWLAHRRRVPLRAIKDNKRIPKRLRSKLTASDYRTTNEDGDERASMIGRGYHGPTDGDIEDMIDLWQYYFRRHGRVLTFADSEGTGPELNDESEPLLDQPWIGPVCGPYHFHLFGIVPDNAMPKSPMHDLYPLQRDYNHVLRKLIRQARRQKSLGLVRKGATEDAEAINRAPDGMTVAIGDPAAFIAADFGGPNQANFAISEALKSMFSWIGGNLDLLGGLSPQSKTATQDKMLNENSSRQIADMQDMTISFTGKILRSLAWYWWHDPFAQMRASYDIPGMQGMSVELTPVTPEMRRQGRFEDLDLKVDAYSMRSQTPEGRAAKLTEVVTQVMAPMMGLLQQQGIAFDANAFLVKLGHYWDIPDLPEIIGIVEPPEPQGGASGGAEQQGAGMPASTTRTYERVSRSGATNSAGESRNRVASLMGADLGGSPERNGKPMMGA